MKTLFLFFLFPITVFSQSLNTIAVLELDPVGISKNETKIISSRLRIDLFNTNFFTVLEREKMEDILTEQGFQLSGCTSDECVLEAGQLLGVKKIVAGSIGKVGNLFTISIRLIDVETGEVIKTATEDCLCGIEDVLTKSVKNVAQILSGKKLSSSNYSTATENKTEKNEWKKLGISKTEWNDYKDSEFSSYSKYINWKENKFFNKHHLELNIYQTILGAFDDLPDDVVHQIGIASARPYTVDIGYIKNRNTFSITSTFLSSDNNFGLGFQYYYSLLSSILYIQPGLVFGFWNTVSYKRENEELDFVQKTQYGGISLRTSIGIKYFKLIFRYDNLFVGEINNDFRLHFGISLSNK